MSDRPVGIVPVAPKPIGRDLGVRTGRGMRQRGTVAITDTAAIGKDFNGNPEEWIELWGLFSGYEISFEGGPWLAFDPGDMFPFPSPNGGVRIRATSSAIGTVVVREWTYEAGLARQGNRGISRTIPSSPSGKSEIPSNLGPAAHQALTTATPGTYTLGADTIYAIVLANLSTAAVAYIARDSTDVNAGATRFAMLQGQIITVYGASFGFLGTTGDHLDVLEFE